MGKCLFMRKGETHTAPVTGILAGDLAVGSSVYLMENGVAVEYLVVNQGIPSGSSLYDASCDGTWLLRKDIITMISWHSSKNNSYSVSSANSYVNGTFFNLFDTTTREIIQNVKIPYINGTGSGGSLSSGANGLSTKIFLLSAYEVGWTSSNNSGFPSDGSCLSYFSGLPETDSKRNATYSGTNNPWWLRSPNKNTTSSACEVLSNGRPGINNVTGTAGIRPAFVLPFNALFDKKTLILKGVA